MVALAVRCKACCALIPSGIRTGWVASPVLGSHALPCGACGALATYHGTDFLPAGAAGTAAAG